MRKDQGGFKLAQSHFLISVLQKETPMSLSCLGETNGSLKVLNCYHLGYFLTSYEFIRIRN